MIMPMFLVIAFLSGAELEGLKPLSERQQHDRLVYDINNRQSPFQKNSKRKNRILIYT